MEPMGNYQPGRKKYKLLFHNGSFKGKKYLSMVLQSPGNRNLDFWGLSAVSGKTVGSEDQVTLRLQIAQIRYCLGSSLNKLGSL